MIPKNKNFYWILVGSHKYRWLFNNPYQILILLRYNQRIGMVENWLSNNVLLRKSLKEIGIGTKDLKYIV